MNAFYEHHQNSIRFGYRCFDRILLNGLIQPFQQPERVVGFFSRYRNQYPVSRDVLREIADQFHNWVKNRSEKWGAPVLDAPQGRRDEFVEPYFRQAKADQLVVILKAREPARILTAIGNKKDNRWHLQLAQRWVIQYNFYVNDRHWGRMFVRLSPYFPFSARVCLNQHHWLARRMQQENIDFQQTTNAFLRCRNPQRLQELADNELRTDEPPPKYGRRYSIFYNQTDLGLLEMQDGLDKHGDNYSEEHPVVRAEIQLHSVRLLELMAIKSLLQDIATHISDLGDGAEQAEVRDTIDRAIQQVLWTTQQVSQYPPELSETDWGDLECRLRGTARWYFKRREQLRAL